jgi:hypothetical protein
MARPSRASATHGHVHGQRLQRNLTVEMRVGGEVDLAHASLAEQLQNFVHPAAIVT